MNYNMILSKTDHTLLTVSASYSDLIKLCDEALKYRTASVCIPPCYVKDTVYYMKRRIPICTVIGFPSGYQTTEAKLYEANIAVEDGADEIDMVINIGNLKDKKYKTIESEINRIKNTIGDRILKVIIETCLLSEEEKIMMCKIVTDAGADYIKTSTGFSKEGAKVSDILLFKDHIGKHVKIKASGGITSIDDAVLLLESGAHRLGTSRMVSIIKELI